MTTRETFRGLLSERRRYPIGSPDWAYRTNAARKLVWLMRGIPVCAWGPK